LTGTGSKVIAATPRLVTAKNWPRKQEIDNMSGIYQTEFDRENGISAITETLGGENVTQIFVHSVTSLDNIGEIAPTAPVYPERALLFARSDDIVCLSKSVDKRYLGFLNGFGIGLREENIIVARENGGQNDLMSLSDLLINDTGAILAIGQLVKQDKEIRLNPFIATPKEFELARTLETALGKKVHLRGDPKIVDYANRKHNVRLKAIELGVPVSEGEIVELKVEKDGKPIDVTPIRTAIHKYIHKTGRVIIRGSYGASGSSLFVVENNTLSIEQALSDIAHRTSNRIYLVEVMLEVSFSPNILMHIEPGNSNIFCISVTDQILSDNLMHDGNVYPSRARTLKEMLTSARKMSAWLQGEGYVGLIGFDFAEHQNQKTGRYEHFLAEINPRVNAAVYPKSMMEYLNQKQLEKGWPTIEAFLSAKIKTTASSFAELKESYGHLFLKPKDGRGLVPYNIGWLAHGKFNLAVFGKSRSQVEEMYEDFKLLLGIQS
jgi:hypothetical protein